MGLTVCPKTGNELITQVLESAIDCHRHTYPDYTLNQLTTDCASLIHKRYPEVFGDLINTMNHVTDRIKRLIDMALDS